MFFLQGWYRDNPHSNKLPPIRMGNLVANDWAELHGPAIKAAATRSAAPAVLALCSENLLPAHEIADQRICDIIDTLVKSYDVFYSEPMFMSDDAIRDLRRLLGEFGVLFMHLREHARLEGELAWQIKPKVHKMQHLASLSMVINPRFVQNYGEESLIGTTTRVWKKSMYGRYANHVQSNILVKRITGLLCRLESNS